MSGKQGEWWMIGVYCGSYPGDEILTLKRCHSSEFPQLNEGLEGRKSICGQVHNLEHKGENFFFHIF